MMKWHEWQKEQLQTVYTMKQKAFRDPFGKIKSDSSIFFQAPEGVLQAPEVVL